MSKILVTGGAGFIGSHLVDALIEKGHDVVVIDNCSSGSPDNVHHKARLYCEDITSKVVCDIFEDEKPEYVYHFAAQTSVGVSMRDVVTDGKVNIIGTLRILELCQQHRVKKIIFASTAAVYGDVDELHVTEDCTTHPLSPYGISKLTAEQYIKHFATAHGLSYTILRFSNVFGPRQTAHGEAGVIAIFIDNLLKGEKVRITGTGEQTRDFIYVKDLVQAAIHAQNYPDNGTFNISTNSATRIKDLFYTLRSIIGSDQEPYYDWHAPVGIKHSRLCNKKALEVLHLTIRQSFEESLHETVAYARRQQLPSGVWIIVSAYNEAKRLSKVIEALKRRTSQIVIVDDFSSDQTAAIAREHGCHVIRHPINFGQGAALQTGTEYALQRGAEIIVHFDGDGQMQVKDIDAIIEPILRGEVDVTMGSRFLKGNDNVPLTKKYFIHKPAIYLNWLLTGMKMTDAHCGFRALSRKAASKCVLRQNRMAHATEILDLVNYHGFRYKEVPVDIVYHHYGQRFNKGFIIIRDIINSKIITFRS